LTSIVALRNVEATYIREELAGGCIAWSRSNANAGCAGL